MKAIIYIYITSKLKLLFELLKYEKFDLVENMFFVISSSSEGLMCSLSNRGDEASMCHYKEIHFSIEKHIFGNRGS